MQMTLIYLIVPESVIRVERIIESKKPSHEGWAKCLMIPVPAAGLEPAT